MGNDYNYSNNDSFDNPNSYVIHPMQSPNPPKPVNDPPPKTEIGNKIDSSPPDINNNCIIF